VSEASPADERPVWARDDAFPEAPGAWGWLDTRGHEHPCGSLTELQAAIRNDRDGGVMLAWTPDHRRMVVPEEIPAVTEAVRAARFRWARLDVDDALGRARWIALMGLILGLWLIWQHRDEPLRTLQALLRSPLAGLFLLAFLIFGFIPWYQARKRLADSHRWSASRLGEAVPVIRFEIWLDRQRAPVTRLLLALVGIVWLAQLFGQDSIAAAGLQKGRYFAGEWWRLFTAPLLHGGWIHLVMNGAGLLYLGKRLEVFARWPHLPLVFLFAAAVGGEASARFIAAPSVGASGGLMGWLGFLLVFETLHARLVPRSARRRLLAGLALTGLIGLVGYRYIDNAAHLGGLLAGMTYAAIVFPRSASFHRPVSNRTDLIAGGGALLALVAAAALAVAKIMAN
jgi:membrane associated rhomboid family serine protease